MNQIVLDLSDPYANFMLNPVLRGSPGICPICLTFAPGYATCRSCSNAASVITKTVLPVTYSIDTEQMHDALRLYKRSPDRRTRRKLRLELSAVLYRFLDQHEACLAHAAGIEGFEVVTTVPSASARRDGPHPLEDMVGRIIPATRDRHYSLLARTDVALAEHEFSTDRFKSVNSLTGKSVLLIDDTWTSGSNAQSSAAALLDAGATNVGVIVIGRHVHREWRGNDQALRNLPAVFDWNRCGLHLQH